VTACYQAIGLNIKTIGWFQAHGTRYAERAGK
jgi:hypothetical protein